MHATDRSNHRLFSNRRLVLGGLAAATLWLAGCAGTGTGVPGQLSDARPAPSSRPAPQPSQAGDARAYRQDAARHVYTINRSRIYAGKLPPLLYAIGTLRVDLDAGGQVTSMHWLRAPNHAPEAIAEIERTVLAAAPYPAAPRIGKLSWTDTWLWDKSGRFQLDTLSEGQLQD
jgi:protein TonB